MERMTTPTGWWAECDDSPETNPFAPEAPWLATLQTAAGCFSLGGIAFYTMDQCLAFIRDDVLGKGSLDADALKALGSTAPEDSEG
jgi:hypothetical protein